MQEIERSKTAKRLPPSKGRAYWEETLCRRERGIDPGKPGAFACGARRVEGGGTVINFTNASRVFLAVEPIDMRKSFNGLHALVVHRLGEDVLAGSWFVFVNRRRTRIKILVWDGTGLWVLAI